jgi:MFS family permease
MSGRTTSRFHRWLRFDGLWRNPDFVRLWAGQSISVFGSLIGRTALHFTAILVLDARPFEIAVLLAMGIVPEVAVAPFVGVWVDRLRRRPIMIVADLGRAALLASIPVAYAFDALTMGQLYVVAFLTGILSMWFGVAYQTYLPSLVKKEELLEGNSKLTATDSVAEVGAFGIAGWLVQIFTGPVAILIDAVSFLFSAFFIGRIRKAEVTPAPKEERIGAIREAKEGIEAILGNRLLRATIGSECLNHLAFGMFGAAFGLYVIRVLDFEPGVLGMIYAVGGISSLIGALFAGRAASRLGTGPAMISGLVFIGASMLLVPLAPEGAAALAAACLILQQLGDGGFVVYSINEVSLRQTITQDRLLGRVNAGFEIAGHGVLLLGILAGGVLGETLGLRGTLLIGAGVMLVAALWLAASPVRSLRVSSGIAPDALPPAIPDAEPVV